MKFSKDYQPVKRRSAVGGAKEVLAVRVEPKTKDYFRQHKIAGKVLDDYAKDKR